MINNSSQKIFNNSILYALGTIASKATAFILIPIYTFNLTSTEYGIATTITTFVSTFGIVIMLSLRAAIIRFLNEYSDREKQIFIGTVVITVMVNSLLFCCLLCGFKNLYIHLIFKDISFYPYVLIGILSLCTEGIYLVYQSVLQAKQFGGLYSINSCIYLVTNTVFVIILVLLLKLSILGVVLANFLTNLFFAIYGIIDMKRRKYMIFVFNKEMFKKSIKYSLPILPHNLANDLNVYSNKIIISNCLNYALSGIYSLASQFSSVVNLIQNSINLAFRPWFIEQMQLGNEGRKQIKYMTEMIMSLFCFISVTVAVFSREFVMMFASEQYHEAWSIIPLFIFVQLVTFIYYSHVQTLMYNVAMSKFTAISSITGLLINIAVALLLVKPLGVYGIAIAQLISKAVLSIIVVVLSNYAEHVDFGLKRMIISLLIAVALMGVSVALSSYISGGMSQIISIILRLLIVGISFFAYISNYIADYKSLFLGILHRKDKNHG